jgi:ribosomal protein L17
MAQYYFQIYVKIDATDQAHAQLQKKQTEDLIKNNPLVTTMLRANGVQVMETALTDALPIRR